MTIDINNSNNNVQQLRRASNNPVANDKANGIGVLNNVNSNTSPSPAKTASDSLTLTDSAINLKKLEESIAQLPIVDMQKVEQIQNKIKDGSYSINPDKIAQRFIEMELAFSR